MSSTILSDFKGNRGQNRQGRLGQQKQIMKVKDSTSKTDGTIHNNKPDITTSANERGTCLLIDTAISGDKKCDQEIGRKYLKI